MNFVKKLLCALTVCAMLTPTAVLAENANEPITLNSTDISLFSSSQNDDILEYEPKDITDEEKPFIEYLCSQIRERNTQISVAEYSITAERLNELWTKYKIVVDGQEDIKASRIDSYLNQYYPELFFVENYASDVNTGNVSSISMTYNAPITADEIKMIEDLFAEFKKHSSRIEINFSDYNTDVYRFLYLWNSGRISAAYQTEYPDLFYLTLDSGMFSQSFNEESVVFYVSKYYMKDTEYNAVIDKLDEEYRNIKSLIDADMTEIEKILVVHDYIAANYEYDMRAYTDPNNASRTLDSMVEQKTGVCQGYAYLFKYIMNKLDFECITVPSNACNHIWNKIKLGDYWYNIDLTSDDATPNISSHISHKFLLVTDEEIRKLDNSNNVLHSDWNHYRWDGTRPAETAADQTYSDLTIHDIKGQIIHSRGNWYGFVNTYDENYSNDNVLSIINVNENTSTPIYSDSSAYKWKVYGDEQQRFYSNRVSSIILYNGDIYFNSPDKVVKFYPEKNGEEQTETVYEYDGTSDVSKTYLYGLTIKDGRLYAEYTTNLNNGIEELILIPVGPETPELTMPCSSSIEKSATFDTDHKLNISVTTDSSYTAVDTDVVYVAEYKGGVIVNIEQKSLKNIQGPFEYSLEDISSTDVKVFVWNGSQAPLANTKYQSF